MPRFVFALLCALLAQPVAAQASAKSQRSVDLFSNVTTRCDKEVPLPSTTGEFRIGTKTYFFVDDQRDEPASEDPNERRQVIFQLFYPAKPAQDSRPAAYVPELDLFVAALRADKRDDPRRIASELAQYACVTASAYPDAPLAPGGKFPVILLSPGGNMSRHWHTAQAQDLASQGYIVAVLSHAYSTLDLFPSGGVVAGSQFWNALKGASAAEERRIDDALSDTLVGDARFALDKIVELSNTKSEELFGRLDASKIAMIGHSRGGKTVARLCSTDPRVKACVTYDNIGPDRERESGLNVPQLAIRTPWKPERVEQLHGYLSRNKTFAFDVVIPNAKHMNFSDLPLIDPVRFPTEGNALSLYQTMNSITLSFVQAAFANKMPVLKGEGLQIKRFGIQQH
jgi:predicted dienelactone hydrolase